MSSYFDDASLVMIPSGYKTSKVYSVKPTDGSGDLTFSRSNDTASRIAPNGLIEKVRTNLVTYSQTLTDASWVGVNIQNVSGGQTDPNGGNTATTFTAFNGFNGIVTKDFATTSGTPYTISIYIKGTASGTINFNRSGVALDPQRNINYTTSWQRFDYSFTADSSTTTIFLGGFFSWDNGEQITFAFAQAETGDIATAYIATTSAAVSVGPVANVPRLDYLNSSCPRLLLEPQRTNFAIYSENISQSSTTLSGGTVATNVVASPDGMQDADSFTVNTANSAHSGYYEAYNATNGQPFTVSVFAKAGTGRYFLFRSMTNTYATRFGATVDLQTGTILSTYNAGVPAPTGTASKIESYGNGWYRISLTMNAIGSQMAYIWETSNSGTPTLDAYLDYSYTGNGTDSYYVWGLQMENGAYATSYIPTLGAAVTRGADACSKTSISSLIGQTEGTLFAEFVHNGADILTTQTVISINSGNTQNFVNIGVYDGQLNPSARASSVDIFDLYVGPNPLPAGTHKIALAYKSGDFKIYLNGSAVYTSTAAATFGTMGQLDLGTLLSFGVQLGEGIKQALVFKTRLSNADLAALTA